MPMTSNGIVKGLKSVTVISHDTDVLIKPLWRSSITVADWFLIEQFHTHQTAPHYWMSLDLVMIDLCYFGHRFLNRACASNSVSSSLPALRSQGTVAAAFTGNPGHLIVVALVNFVKVHQLLLSTVIGKHGIFAACFFTAPVAVVLRALEAVVDTIAFFLIGCIAPSGPDHDLVVKASGSLKISVSQAVKVYSN
ncbi:hypothetical protein C8J56DRAFT_1051223 [Mycena floridula]|nr:hypothetical protein C8J56DRAFT_1051223 [Mycena floridula]